LAILGCGSFECWVYSVIYYKEEVKR